MNRSLLLSEKLKLGAVMLLLLTLFTFAVLNRQTVELSLILATIEMPRSLMIFSVLGIGFMTGWLANSLIRRRKHQPTMKLGGKSQCPEEPVKSEA